MLWEVDIYPAAGQPDLLGRSVAAAAADLGLAADLAVAAARGYLIQGDAGRAARSSGSPANCWPTASWSGRWWPRSATRGSLPASSRRQSPHATAGPRLIHVLPKPGVMDPVAQSVLSAIADFGLQAEAVRTLKKYWIGGLPDDRLEAALLEGPGQRRHRAGDRRAAGVPTAWRSARPTSSAWRRCRSGAMDDAALERLSLEGQLYLSLVEMQTIQAHFRSLGRDPTDVELETVAQTWSEHCSHKTLAGRIRYRDDAGRADASRTCSARRSSPPRRRSAARPAPTTGASASSRTTPAWSASTTSTTWSSRSRRTTIPRPWSPTAGPTRASAA